MPRLTTAKKLQKRLQDTLKFPVGLPKRCYAGHWQRSQGAWSWRASCNGGSSEIGSQMSMTELLKMNDEDFDGWID